MEFKKKKKKAGLLPLSANEHVCGRGRQLTIAQGQCVTSYVLGVPFIFRLFAAFVVKSTPPYECKIETLPQEEFVTPALFFFFAPGCPWVFAAVVGIVGASFHSLGVRGHRPFTPMPLLLLWVSTDSLHFTPTVPWALSRTSFKGKRTGGIQGNKGVFFTSAECTFLPRPGGISVYLFVIEMMAVGLHSRSCTAVYSSSRWPPWHTPILRFGGR